MANGLTAAERAMQILAEIELEEKLKNEKQFSEERNVPQSTVSSNVNNIASENKMVTPKSTVPVQNVSENIQETEDNIINLNNISQKDILNGFIFSEILDKPLALRRYRR